jgi:3-methyladenine DNA glycosylase/8-oxoguanine DNA glycosylase
MVVRLNMKTRQDETKGSAAPTASVASFSSSAKTQVNESTAKTQVVSEADKIVEMAEKKLKEAGGSDAKEESGLAAAVAAASKEKAGREGTPLDEKQDAPRISNPNERSNPE